MSEKNPIKKKKKSCEHDDKKTCEVLISPLDVPLTEVFDSVKNMSSFLIHYSNNKQRTLSVREVQK